MSASYEYYRIFYYVAKCRSISRAAKMLSNNQPNVTRAMNNLEAQLGCRLLIRSPKGIELTDAGKQLYEHVSVAVEHLNAGEREIAGVRALETGELHIAATEIALHRVLLPALQHFRSEYPGVRIRVSNYSTPEAIASVRAERAELAVVSNAEAVPVDLSCSTLTTYSECLTAGMYYRELSERVVSLSELMDHPWISLGRDTQTFRCCDRLFLEQGLSFEPDVQAATMDQVLPMVRYGLGLAFLPDFIARPAISRGEIIEIPLRETIPDRTVSVVHLEKRSMSAAAVELIRFLRLGRDQPAISGK